MAGFGGSPGLALFGGLTEGFNKRREEDRAAERQSVLNSLAEAQIQQMKDNARRQEQAQKMAQQQAAQAAEKAEEEREAEMSRLQAAAETYAERMNIPIEQALPAVQNMTPTQLGSLFEPPEEADPVDTARDQELLRGNRLRNQALERDLSVEQGLTALRGHPIVGALRNVINSGDATAVDDVRRIAVRDYGFDEAVVDAYIDSRGGVPAKQDAEEPEVDRDAAEAFVVTSLARAQEAGKSIDDLVAFYRNWAKEGDDPQKQARVEAFRQWYMDTYDDDPFVLGGGEESEEDRYGIGR